MKFAGKLIALVGGLVALGALVPVAASDAPPRPMLTAGAAAPDFGSFDIEGKEVRVADYRGQVLILDFWATWCAPCVASMPHTQEIAAKYADQGVTVLAVCTGDKRRRFEDWVKLKAASYPAMRFTFDPHEQGTPAESERASVALYGVPAIPTQFVIDRDGRIVGSITGYFRGDTSLEKALAAAGVKVDLKESESTEKSMRPVALGGGTAPGDSKTTLRPANGGSVGARPAAEPRRPAPPFVEAIAKVKAGDVLTDVDFHAADGTPRRLSDYRGKPLVLLLAPAEMIPVDYLNEVVEKFGADRVQVLALVTRDTEANYQAWLALNSSRGNRFATAFDPVPVAEARNGVINRLFGFGAPAPFSMVVDAQGRFVGLFPWKLPQGQAGLAELLRRCGVAAREGKASQ